MPSHSFNTKPFTSLLNNFGSGAGKGKGGTRPGSGGWRVPSGVSGDASFTYDSGGLDLSEWAELVKLKVRSNWIIPTAAYMGMKGITGIYLVIEKTGVVSQCEIIRQSGVISMDSAAFNAVRGSSPLPKLPDIYPKSSMEAHFTFYYNIFLQE